MFEMKSLIFVRTGVLVQKSRFPGFSSGLGFLKESITSGSSVGVKTMPIMLRFLKSIGCWSGRRRPLLSIILRTHWTVIGVFAT